MGRRNKLSRPRIPAYIGRSMSRANHWFIVAGTALVLMFGCDDTGVGPEDETAVLSNPETSYNDRDNRFYTAITAVPPVGSGEVDSIWIDLFLVAADSIGTDSSLVRVPLVDDATNGDILPADGVYARKFDSPLSPDESGPVRIVFMAVVATDTHTVVDTLYLDNVPPAIDSVVVSAPTVTRPATVGVVVVDTLYVFASDANGTADLKTVTFKIVKPDGSLGVGAGGITDFPLYDDGTREDVTATDGIFTGGITFQSSNPLGTYTLRFVAQDFSGARTDTVDREIVVQ